jgi:histidinol-phosphatase (PHP family)
MHTVLPPDSHVHSQWSWDAPAGSMEQTCQRAVDLGLPSVAFTEHVDFTPWNLPDGWNAPSDWQSLVDGDVLVPPALDLDGYLECLHRCRERFPDLHIASGIELSEPHWHANRSAQLLTQGGFDRVLASVHSAAAAAGEGCDEVSGTYRHRAPEAVVREYLAETTRLIEQFDDFEVLAHIDYPVRYWPADAAPYEPRAFEDDYRTVLQALAAAGKALEVNTRVPLHPQIVRWWRQEGGDAITFGSDAHDPTALARGFTEATAMAEACGFRPGRHPNDLWRRG